MRLILITILLFTAITSQAQQKDSTCYIKQVGWTFTIPAGYKLMSVENQTAMLERGKKTFEKTLNEQMDLSELTTLFTFTKGFNHFSATIKPYYTKKDGNYKQTQQGVSYLTFETLKQNMPNAQLDSATTDVSIDGLVFNQFTIAVSIKEKVLYSMVILSAYYKKYDFGITYLYMTEAVKKEIEELLQNSSFKNKHS